MREIKIVQSLDQPYTAHLKQIIRILSTSRKFLYHTKNKPEIPADKFIPHPFISGFDRLQHFLHLPVPIPRQF